MHTRSWASMAAAVLCVASSAYADDASSGRSRDAGRVSIGRAVAGRNLGSYVLRPRVGSWAGNGQVRRSILARVTGGRLGRTTIGNSQVRRSILARVTGGRLGRTTIGNDRGPSVQVRQSLLSRLTGGRAGLTRVTTKYVSNGRLTKERAVFRSRDTAGAHSAADLFARHQADLASGGQSSLSQGERAWVASRLKAAEDHVWKRQEPAAWGALMGPAGFMAVTTWPVLGGALLSAGAVGATQLVHNAKMMNWNIDALRKLQTSPASAGQAAGHPGKGFSA